MDSHVHASAMTALTVFLMVIIVGFFWRMLSMRLSESPIGKAMSVLY